MRALLENNGCARGLWRPPRRAYAINTVEITAEETPMWSEAQMRALQIIHPESEYTKEGDEESSSGNETG